MAQIGFMDIGFKVQGYRLKGLRFSLGLGSFGISVSGFGLEGLGLRTKGCCTIRDLGLEIRGQDLGLAEVHGLQAWSLQLILSFLKYTV